MVRCDKFDSSDAYRNTVLGLVNSSYFSRLLVMRSCYGHNKSRCLNTTCAWMSYQDSRGCSDHSSLIIPGSWDTTICHWSIHSHTKLALDLQMMDIHLPQHDWEWGWMLFGWYDMTMLIFASHIQSCKDMMISMSNFAKTPFNCIGSRRGAEC